MKKQLVSYAQTGLEGARWLRNEAEVGGTLRKHLQGRSFREAGLLAVRGGLQLLPDFDVRRSISRLVVPQYEIVGIGSEAVVIRDENNVNKYLTGKSQSPETLQKRMIQLDNRARSHLGLYLAPTSICIERLKLFKSMPGQEYVRLQQPFIKIEHTDPHKDPKLLDERPEISDALTDFSDRLVSLFEEEGLLMDIVNAGNLVWGSIGDDDAQLYLLDTVPIDYAEHDFTGIKVPFWSPGMHLEYLVEFVEAAHSGEYFSRDSTREWIS